MASTEYDQYDNDYKPVGSAKKIEEARDRAMEEGAREVQEKREYERELAESRERAAEEARLEMLKRQQEQRDLRTRKREEQREREESEAIERKRDVDMARGAKESAAREARAARSSKRIEEKRDIDMDEGARASAEAMSSPTRLKAIGNVNEAFDTFRGSAAAPKIEKARKAYEQKRKEETPFGRLSLKAEGFFTDVKKEGKRHIEQSFNDIFRAPMNPYHPEKNPTGVKRMQKTPARKYTPKGFRAPTGLLDLGSFAAPHPFVLSKPKAAPKKARKNTSKKAVSRLPAPRKRSLLDDEFGFF